MTGTEMPGIIQLQCKAAKRNAVFRRAVFGGEPEMRENTKQSVYGKHRKVLLVIRLTLLICLLFSLRPYAAYKDQWVSKKGKYYYYDASGKQLKGRRKINDRFYYLDSKGVQRTGWRKVGKKYYFFRTRNGKDGYMRANTTVNGVKLNKDGSAKLTSRSKRKLKILIKCQKILDSVAAPGASREKKLSRAFEYAKSRFRARNIGGFSAGGDWDMRYAEFMLNTGSGDCYCYGAVFAYLATAIGYDNVYACSSGGHGWCRIGSRYYDPNWARVIGTAKCFGAARGESGRNGRPHWAAYERYIKKVS